MSYEISGEKFYPVKGEDYSARGNLFKLTNPTHNAEGRWEFINSCIEYITRDISQECVV